MVPFPPASVRDGYGVADSIGSSREVVSRALMELRAAGIVETAPRVVWVVNPQRLVAMVRAFVI